MKGSAMGWTAIESASVEVSVDALAAHGPVLLAAVRDIRYNTLSTSRTRQALLGARHVSR